MPLAVPAMTSTAEMSIAPVEQESVSTDELAEVDVLVASSSLPAGKPDVRAFRGALARIGAHAEEALMIGDSLEEDVRGALRAGLDAVLVDRGGDGRARDVRTVASLDEVTFGTPPVGGR